MPFYNERAALLGQTAFQAGSRGFESRLPLSSMAAFLEVIHKPPNNRRIVMTARESGFCSGNTASKEHLPSFPGNHLPPLPRLTKVFTTPYRQVVPNCNCCPHQKLRSPLALSPPPNSSGCNKSDDSIWTCDLSHDLATVGPPPHIPRIARGTTLMSTTSRSSRNSLFTYERSSVIKWHLSLQPWLLIHKHPITIFQWSILQDRSLLINVSAML